jgi:hypothetical protein
MNMKPINVAMCVLAIMMVAVGSAQAAMMFTGAQVTGGTGCSYYGAEFTVGASDVHVTALGAFDYGQTFPETALILDGGNVIASVTVTPSSTLVDGFRYESDAVDLLAGHTYTLLVAETGSSTFSQDPTMSGDFTNYARVYGLDPADPTNLTRNGAGSYCGPNLQYTLTPEPATMALLAIGGIGALLRRRK